MKVKQTKQEVGTELAAECDEINDERRPDIMMNTHDYTVRLERTDEDTVVLNAASSRRLSSL